MHRLHSENDLASFLRKQRHKDIVIVSAFASGTVELLKAIAAENNLEVILGTINAFTSPSFIDQAGALLKQQLWVDFRGNSSIHWKLYLISPDIVIVGSANFTQQGVSLRQDTCVVIQSAELFAEYQQAINVLKKEPQVIAVGAPDFATLLERHRQQHNRNQQALQIAYLPSLSTQKKGRARNVLSFEEWAKQGQGTIPLFVWDKDHSEAEKNVASQVVAQRNDLVGEVAEVTEDTGPPAPSGAKKYKDFLTCNIDGAAAPFLEGLLVIATKHNGAYMRFMQLNVVHPSAEDNRYYMIELPKTRYSQLFEITPEIKAAIVRLIEKGQREPYAIAVDVLQAELHSS